MTDKSDLAQKVRDAAGHFAAAVTNAQRSGLTVCFKFYRSENERGVIGPELSITVDISEHL